MTQSDQKVEENQILVAELERVEKEKVTLEKRNGEVTKQFRTQTKMLQEKLSRSYQDIQQMVQAQASRDAGLLSLQERPAAENSKPPSREQGI